ncbi:hypothetical protein K501DRAFT_191877 [Backusella circina FSU 941]|nr:hypothetical protein K501DRAFT_191877 [Backusella circina FSU 941]
MSVDSQDYWFNGPVAEAISLVGQRNCVLLVYIYDESEKSTTLDKTLGDSKVGSVIKEKAVALRMKKESEEANMFGQYYPTAHTPIVYFIQQGTIRDFVVETVTKEELVDKLNSMVTLAPNDITPSMQSEPIHQQVAPQQSNMSDVVEEQPSLDTTTAAAAVSDETEKKEKELEKAKQDRIDRENKIYFDKIKKERKADEEHKKKVREQIARDRAEKIASRKAERERQSSIDDGKLEQQQGSSSSPSKSYNTCNLNIRQLDGSTIRHQFNADDALSVVRNWINENRTDGSGVYRLSAQFPSRTFTETDDTELLSSLNLCPSATIIMKPAKKKGNVITDASPPNRIVGLASSSFHFIYSLIFNLFHIISGLLTTLFPRNGLANVPENDQQQQQQQLRSLKGGQRLGGESSSSSTGSSAAAMKRRNPYSSHVNTLHEEDDNNGKDDDRKKTTYNGNSVNHE